jgi:hypothetical protein
LIISRLQSEMSSLISNQFLKLSYETVKRESPRIFHKWKFGVSYFLNRPLIGLIEQIYTDFLSLKKEKSV